MAQYNPCCVERAVKSQQTNWYYDAREIYIVLLIVCHATASMTSRVVTYIVKLLAVVDEGR